MHDRVESARRYVAKMPAAVAGQGGHDATFKVACVLLQGFDLAMSDAASLLAEYNVRCAPPWSERELAHKLRQADKASGLETREGLKPRGCLGKEFTREDGPREELPPSKARSAPPPMEPPKKPEFDAEKLRAFSARWRQFIDTAWLADRSPVPPWRLAGALSADEFLRSVFREGEKVVIFTNQQSQGQALWPLQPPPRGGDEGVWYLAQPVDGREHVNPRAVKNGDGTDRMSRRSEESVTAWRHLVLESDEADARDWMAALVQLPLRTVAIYTSGGRSIHALVRVDAPTKQEWDNLVKQIRPILVTLGADPKAMSAVRLTRLPGCWRGDRLQKLLYLNPASPLEPICTMKPLRATLPHLFNAADQFMATTASDVARQGCWEMVEQIAAGLAWFNAIKCAAEYEERFSQWMKGDGSP